MHRKNKLAVAAALAGCACLLLILLPKWRQAQPGEHGVFAGSFLKSSGVSLRCPPSDFFDDAALSRLIESAIRGDRAKVQAARVAGVNMNRRGRAGITPLMLAVLNFSLQGFDLLLEAGADPNVAADNGDSAMTLAAIVPDASYLRSALRHGGRADGPDRHGRTPLMLCVSHARGDQTRLLIEAGADVNANDARGGSPLIFAMQAPKPDREIVRLLLAHGARAVYTNPAGLTARDYAAAFEDPTLLKWLNP